MQHGSRQSSGSTARSRRRSLPIFSIATGTTSPATRGPTSFSSSVDSPVHCATSPPTIRTTCRPFRSTAAADSPSRPTRRNWPSPRISIPSGHQHQRGDLHARPDQSRGEAGEGEHLGWRQLQPRLLARWQVSRVAQPGARWLRERQVPADALRPRSKDDQGSPAEIR